jgi:hypothetical protein
MWNARACHPLFFFKVASFASQAQNNQKLACFKINHLRNAFSITPFFLVQNDGGWGHPRSTNSHY